MVPDKKTTNLPSLNKEYLPYVSPVDAALARRSPLKGARLSYAVCGLFVVAILWAAFAELDEVIQGNGQVIAAQRTQAIQNLEGGILRSILVSEGQIVDKGTPLAQLDNEMAESNYRDARQRMLENQVALQRLEAERKGERPVFSDELKKDAPQAVADHTSSFESRQLQHQSEIAVLESQYRQRSQELEEQLSRKKQLDKSLQLAIEQRNIATPLVARSLFPRTEYLGLEQRVVQLQGDVDSLIANIPKVQAAMQEAKQRIAFRNAEIESVITDEINKRRTELQSLRETLSAGGDRITRTELRSPVRGTIKQIHIHSVGGVVKPGESIMEVVPLDDTLLIEAKVRPADVAFLRPGQAAMIKLSAYDFSIYGGLEAAVVHISADTIEDKRGEVFYLVQLKTKKNAITYHNQQLPIMPGMIATVDIMTGKKTVLDYLMKPILKARQNAMRER